MNSFEKLTKVNDVSKTIRFEMIPNEDTVEYLRFHMENDIVRASNKNLAKQELDREYREFIIRTLKDSSIEFKELEKCITTGDVEEIKKYQEKYRKKIVDLFKKDSEYTILFKNKEIVNKILNEHEEENLGLSAFRNFTTYFTPFMENRKNVFSSEDKITSLAYRAININFNDFLYNKKIFEDIVSKNPQFAEDFSKYLYKHGVINDEEELYNAFKTDSYNKYILQDGIDYFNSIVGGVVLNEKEKIKGFNQIAKEYNDSNKSSKRIPFMRKIKKQILSHEESKNFKYDTIENNEELLDINKRFIEKISDKRILESLENVIKNINEYNKEKIYFSDILINKISYRIFRDYRYLKDNMKKEIEIEYLKENNLNKLTKTNEKKLDKIIFWKDNDSDIMSFNKDRYISLDIIDSYTKSIELEDENGDNNKFDFINEFTKYVDIAIYNAKEQISTFKSEEDKLNELNIMKDKNIDTIKDCLDSLIEINKIIKLIYPENIIDIDRMFYYEIEKIYENISDLEKVYNKTRNFVTKSDFSNEKIKLNFDYPTFASGWSKTKEKDNGAIILRRNGKYYIGVLNHIDKVSLNEYEKEDSFEDDYYEKMNYMVFKDPSKMFPKCMFTKDVKKHFETKDSNYEVCTDAFSDKFVVKRDLYDVFNTTVDGKKKFQKDYLKKNPDREEEYYKALRIAIDGCKTFLEKYKSTQIYDFTSLKSTEEYKSIDEFYRDISMIAYDISFVKIPAECIDKLAKNGDILLFEIYCKDFSEYSTGKKNLHTMYFESLFSEENKREKFILRLAGNAEVFFRKKSITNPFVHSKGTKIINKTYYEDNVEKNIPSEFIPILNKIINNEKLTEKENEICDLEKLQYYIDNATNIKELKNDIVKNKRYTVDKFFLHMPIVFNAEINKKSLNKEIENVIKSKKHNIIGIDRGERNLIYITVINPDGEILLQKSMNIISQKSSKVEKTIDFHRKLDTEEKRRDMARKSWKKIGKIRNFKEGYLSLVVHEICKLVLEYDAFLVMENLNAGFKRTRNKFEKQVYQKFEKMLCSKMNYLTFKDRKIIENGGILKGYQLSGEYKENQIRNGIIFYVPAGYTSNIDPTTGFTNPIKLGTIKTFEDKKEILNSMDSISYSEKENIFTYRIDIEKIDNNKKIKMFRKKWDVNTFGERIVYDTKLKVYNKINITKFLLQELEDNGIKLEEGVNLKDVILQNRKLVNAFYYGYCLAVKMRNSKKDTDIDYIISPVKNDNDEFYDSREVGDTLPKNADANGAYNIARKGNYLINNKYKNELEKEKPEYKLIVVSNKDWFEYAQKGKKSF